MTISPKVAAGGVAGAVSIVLVFVLAQFGVILPAEVAQAVTLILSFVAGYATGEHDEPGDHAAP
jgi:hypothetical protein